MRRRWLRLVVMMVVVGGLCVGVFAQESGGDTVYHLHGSVVDGVTGKPVARALVQSNDRRLATMTDGEGRFAVDVSVPPVEGQGALGAGGPAGRFGGMGRGFGASLYLTAQKPGYMSSQSTNNFSSIALDETLASRDVVLKLMPAASLSGRVSASGVDAAAGVSVMLMMRQVDDDGRLQWVHVGNHVTNRRGEFRLGNLLPGEYALSTLAWQGEQPYRRTGLKAVTQVYPAVYFGDVGSLAAAVKVHLRVGEQRQAEIHLHLQNEYAVTVPVRGIDAGVGVNCQVMSAGGDGFERAQMRYDAKAGTFSGELPDGNYTVRVASYGTAPQFGSAVVHVEGAAVETAAVTMAPAGLVEVRVHAQFTAADPAAASGVRGFSGAAVAGRGGFVPGSAQKPQVYPLAQVSLRPEGNLSMNGGGEMMPTDRDDAFSLKNVAPGRYTVTVRATRGYVASVTAAGVDVLERPLVVGAGATLDVVLRDDGGTVTGKVTGLDSEADVRGQPVFVELLPTDASARFVQGYAGADGVFNVSNVAPGSYRMVAMRIRQRPQIAYRDADEMHRFDGKGVALTVGSGGKVQADVALLSDADMESK